MLRARLRPHECVGLQNHADSQSQNAWTKRFEFDELGKRSSGYGSRRAPRGESNVGPLLDKRTNNRVTLCYVESYRCLIRHGRYRFTLLSSSGVHESQHLITVIFPNLGTKGNLKHFQLPARALPYNEHLQLRVQVLIWPNSNLEPVRMCMLLPRAMCDS